MSTFVIVGADEHIRASTNVAGAEQTNIGKRKRIVICQFITKTDST